MTVRDVIELVKAQYPPQDAQHTCDTVKAGDTGVCCTGVSVTCSPTVEAICGTAELGDNLLICHEALYYNHADETDWLTEDPVFEAKRRLVTETGIVIWRNHDHIHGDPPWVAERRAADGIFYGIMEELGWASYLVGDPKKPLLYRIPKRTVRELADELMEKLNLNGLRVVGDLCAPVETVCFCEHILPSDEKGPTRLAREADADVYIPLEIIDWTLSAYIRDACQIKQKKVILEMGHFNVEELGMKYLAKHLSRVLPENIPVHFVQSGDSYQYLTR